MTTEAVTKTSRTHNAGRALAVLVAALAPVVMASAQARVIFDRVVLVHPAWPTWTAAAMAIGFELCILTTGLAIVVVGHRDRTLIAGEVFLIAMSVLVAVTGAFALPTWVLPLTLALVPIQYAVAFYAAHALYVHWYGQNTAATAPVAPAEVPSSELGSVSAASQDAPGAPAHAKLNGHDDGVLVPALDPPVHINGVGTITVPPGAPPYLPNPKPRRRRPAGQAKLTPEMYRALAAEHVPDGAGAQEADRIVAEVAGVSAKTAQRMRLAT